MISVQFFSCRAIEPTGELSSPEKMLIPLQNEINIWMEEHPNVQVQKTELHAGSFLNSGIIIAVWYETTQKEGEI